MKYLVYSEQKRYDFTILTGLAVDAVLIVFEASITGVVPFSLIYSIITFGSDLKTLFEQGIEYTEYSFTNYSRVYVNGYMAHESIISSYFYRMIYNSNTGAREDELLGHFGNNMTEYELISLGIGKYCNDVHAKSGHTYDFACSTSCNVCGGGNRDTEHSYNCEEKVCKICGFLRYTTSTHKYEYPVKTNDQHYAQCTECGDEPVGENHVIKYTFTPTRHYKYCSLCSHSLGDVPHRLTDWAPINTINTIPTYPSESSSFSVDDNEQESIASNESTNRGLSSVEDIQTASSAYNLERYCKDDCGYYEYGNCTQHTYGAWIPVTTATCTSAGSQKRVCNTCSHTETQSVTISHNWGSWTTTTSATCSTIGSQKRTCTNCSQSETQSIPVTTVHTWGSWINVTSATCSSTGSQKRTCTKNSSHTETQNTSTNSNHNWGSWSTTTSATCSSTGSKKELASITAVIQKHKPFLPTPITIGVHGLQQHQQHVHRLVHKKDLVSITAVIQKHKPFLPTPITVGVHGLQQHQRLAHHLVHKKNIVPITAVIQIHKPFHP